MTDRVELKGMVPKSYGTQVPENHVPNGEECYYFFDMAIDKYNQLGACTGESLEDYSQEGGSSNVPVWTFKFYSIFIKSNFSKYLKEGRVYYKVSLYK